MNRRRPTNIQFYDDVDDANNEAAGNAGLLPANSATGTGNFQQQGPMQQLSQMSAIEKSLFAGYLINTVFPMMYKQAYVEVAGTNIYQMFDQIDLAYFYRRWKQEGGGQMQQQFQQPPPQMPPGFFGQ